MRTENELTMRNLRNVNQDLQAQLKEVKSVFITVTLRRSLGALMHERDPKQEHGERMLDGNVVIFG